MRRFIPFTTSKRGHVSKDDWDVHKEFIMAQVDEKKSHKAIITALRNQKGVTIKSHQLKRVLKDWGASKQNLNLLQRSHIWNVLQERTAIGKLSTTFQFKGTRKDVKETQVDAIRDSDGRDFAGDFDGSPGLIHFTPAAVDDTTADNTVIENDINQMVDEEVTQSDNEDMMVDPVGPEIPPDSNEMDYEAAVENINNDGNAPIDDSHIKNLGDPESSEPEPLDIVCQTILDSVNAEGDEDPVKSKAGNPEPKSSSKSNPSDYSIIYQHELEKNIAQQRALALSFLKEVNKEVAASGDTLDECYTRLQNNRFRNSPGLVFDAKEMLDLVPLSVCHQMCQSDKPERVESKSRRDVVLWKEMCSYFKAHIDEIAKFALAHGETDRNYAIFCDQVAHVLTLSKRFGTDHFFTFQAAAWFLDLIYQSGRAAPPRLAFRILLTAKNLGIDMYATCVDLLHCTQMFIKSEVEENNLTNVKHMIPVARAQYRAARYRHQRRPTTFGDFRINFALIGLAVGYHENHEPKNAQYILQFVKRSMMSLDAVNPDTRVLRASVWAQMGNANLDCNQASDAKFCSQKSYDIYKSLPASFDFAQEYSFHSLRSIAIANALQKDYRGALENMQKVIEYRKEFFGPKDNWYLLWVGTTCEYMEERGLVRYSQPILSHTIEVCEDLGENGEAYQKLVVRYLGGASTAFMLDMNQLQDFYPSYSPSRIQTLD